MENIGIIANYTFADGELDYVDLDGVPVVTTSFPGLSKHSANATLYYETENWGVRGSLAYRSDYITDVEVGLTDEDSRGQFGSTFIDMSAYVRVNDQLKVTLEGINLTNEAEIAYSDSAKRLTERRNSGATLFGGFTIQF